MKPRPVRTGLLALGLAVITLATFAPTLRNGFVDWDDRALLLDNAAYRGLGGSQVRWMFHNALLGHYVPVTWLSFALDYVVWGLNPVGYHLTNVLLHAANAVLFFYVARALLERGSTLPRTARHMAAVVAALFFAIHPLRVESVAWVTERRGVLSGLFFLLTVLTYVRGSAAAGGRRRGLLVMSGAAYLLALGAKETVMTLPVVLVLLDVYPLGRLPGDPRRWFGYALRGVWLEKLPYALLALADAVVAYRSQTVGAGARQLDMATWIGLAAQSLWFHVVATLFPWDLSPLYELPQRIDLWEPRVLTSMAGLIGVSVVFLRLRRGWPAGLAAWAYSVIMMAPVIAPAHAGPQLTADRYSYLAGLSWALLIGAGAGAAAQLAVDGALRPVLARLLGGVAVAAFVALGVLSWELAQIWRDTESLWQYAVAAQPDCARCRSALGSELLDRQQYAQALHQLQWVLAHRPDYPWIHGNIGLVLASLGRFPEAIEQYEVELTEHPDAVNVRVNLATALMKVGKLQEAVDHVRHAVRLGAPGAAAAYFRGGVRSPDPTIAHLGLLELYLSGGHVELAQEQYESLQRLNSALAVVAMPALRK